MPSSPSSGVGKAILIAAILSLLVTAVRLYGELEGWNPTIWNREPGGGGSPLGVSWLMLPFGFWFGRRLAKGGSRPGPTGKALLLHVVGIGLVVGVFALAINFLSDWHQRAYLINGGAVACGLLALFAWPRAWLTNVTYALLARAPVAVVQYLSIDRGWDTHFAKGPPESPPEDALFLLTMAQFGMWPFAITALVGGLCAVLGAATVKKG
jgi:hypothetical protein